MPSCSSSLTFWILSLFFIFILFCTWASPSTSASPFTPVNNVTLYGDAHFKNNSICLTQPRPGCLPPSPSPSPSNSSSSGMGRAIYIYPIRFLESATNTTASFSCRFTFTIIPSSPFCALGDGLTFLITSNAAYVPIPEDGHLGLPEPTQDSSFMAVEFDTSFDPSLGDINGNHIGIDLNAAVSFASDDAMASGFDLKNGRPITAWIDYRDAVKTIRVWVGYSLVRPPSPVLVAHIDLSRYFREFMHVGFSASNGEKGSAFHLVERWRFKTSGFETTKAAPVDSAVEEGDCFMCIPDESDGSNGSSALHKGGGVSLAQLWLGLGGLAAFLFSAMVVFAIACCLVRRRRNRATGGRERKEGRISRVQFNRVPTTLSLAEVKSATAGFNPHRIIGEGASATVYEGLLPSGESVAVKRFSAVNAGGFRDPFATEFATMVSYLRHKNLVQLQGWCCEGDELVLVYEYMPNGSLDRMLHRNCNSKYLTWERRLKIVYGIASALAYLHEECERQIIHRDVKACNIMLDAEFNAKLGDFGLAEVYDHSSMVTRDATIPAGTMGYLAPEYVYSGVPTEKTDVYSFGVVILEVATGRRPVEDDGVVVSDWVWELWGRGKLIEAADLRLRGRFNVVEMKRMLMVGLSCVHPNCDRRPRVKEAARIIKGEAPLPILPARKPKMRVRTLLPEETEEFPNFRVDNRHSGAMDDAEWLTPKSHFSIKD